MAFSAASANILYYETDLGSGSWKYDYIFYNTSTTGESIYNIWFDFTHTSTVTGSPLPTGWNGTVWEGINNTDYIDTFSTNAVYDISAGSFLGGFNFIIDYQAGEIPYTAYYNGVSDTSLFTNGITTMVPEPISSFLFLTGASLLVGKSYFKNRRHS